MYKWIYDRLIGEYKKESKKELANQIIALKNIETSDRAFANECLAGSTVMRINELFEEIDRLKEVSISKNELSIEELSRLFDLMDSAMSSWKSITKEFIDMRNPERFSNEICDLKQKISSANKPNDII